ncbi:MAG: hypothetical protein HOQ43_14735, partial [Glycomyces artemisiae]|nr:hypothetical protein [Glycomyces artemisiae]
MERLGPARADGADGRTSTRIRMGGIGIDPVTGAAAVARVLDAIEAGRGGHIVTPNVDILAAARRSRALRA